jgi:type III pantothenate kinase
MKVICLDFGNTFCKIAEMENGMLLHVSHFLLEDAEMCIKKVIDSFAPTHAILCSVLHPAYEILALLSNKTILLELTDKTVLPFANLYLSPDTLGKDRLALIAQAAVQFPQQHTLVICAGTCVTYNFINDQNEFLGGAISPGLNMRLKSMHHFTQKLPLAENKQMPNLIGTDTISSLQSGAINGLRAEIDETIASYVFEHGKINVVLTGGDMSQLALLLKSRIFADANFLFKGLYTILQFHYP